MVADTAAIPAHRKFGRPSASVWLTPGTSNPFVDPEGYQAYVADREKAFLTELKKQRDAAAKQRD